MCRHPLPPAPREQQEPADRDLEAERERPVDQHPGSHLAPDISRAEWTDAEERVLAAAKAAFAKAQKAVAEGGTGEYFDEVGRFLTRVTGVPLLEAKAEKKWGGQPDYEAYKAATPVLIPKLFV